MGFLSSELSISTVDRVQNGKQYQKRKDTRIIVPTLLFHLNEPIHIETHILFTVLYQSSDHFHAFFLVKKRQNPVLLSVVDVDQLKDAVNESQRVIAIQEYVVVDLAVDCREEFGILDLLEFG